MPTIYDPKSGREIGTFKSDAEKQQELEAAGFLLGVLIDDIEDPDGGCIASMLIFVVKCGFVIGLLVAPLFLSSIVPELHDIINQGHTGRSQALIGGWLLFVFFAYRWMNSDSHPKGKRSAQLATSGPLQAEPGAKPVRRRRILAGLLIAMLGVYALLSPASDSSPITSQLKALVERLIGAHATPIKRPPVKITSGPGTSAKPPQTTLHFTNPWDYCDAVGSSAGPDDRYEGQELPAALLSFFVERGEYTPGDQIMGIVWRCKSGEVKACVNIMQEYCRQGVAVLEPTDEMLSWCRDYPDAELIPLAVMGHVPHEVNWRCSDGDPVVDTISTDYLDEDGYTAELWHTVPRP